MFDILSIGHSDLTEARFLTLLTSHKVDVIADVRSVPFSRRNPQFSRNELRCSLKKLSMKYVFLGKELGGRPVSDADFTNGIADYDKMAARPPFDEGIHRLLSGAESYRIAMVCSEREPLDCHRCLLVSRRLVREGARVAHIHSGGTLESHEACESRLLALLDRDEQDLFEDTTTRLNIAYRKRSERVAYKKSEGVPSGNDRENIHDRLYQDVGTELL
jgi:uncharacterized protein (DUF488 family)